MRGARPVIGSQSDCRGLTRHVKGAFITQTDAAVKCSLALLSPVERNQLLVKVPTDRREIGRLRRPPTRRLGKGVCRELMEYRS